jgi:hypothetical protein
MRNLFRTAFHGAVEGGKAVLLLAAGEWLEQIVLLDASIHDGTGSWTKRLVHRALPSSVFYAALFETISRQRCAPRYEGVGPAYAVRGSGKTAGMHPVTMSESRRPVTLSEEAGCVPLCRAVRTADGKVALQHLLIKERKDAADEAKTTA